MKTKYIFISHSSKDLDFAHRIARDLLDRGYEIWLDDWYIIGDKPYWDEIQAAVQNCGVFLYILSPASCDPLSGARTELFHAHGLRTHGISNAPTIIPIRIQNVSYDKIPIVITEGQYQIHDFVNKTYEDALQRTFNAIAKVITVPLSTSVEVDADKSSQRDVADMTVAPRVFLSYRSAAQTDREIASAIAHFLRMRGCEVVDNPADDGLLMSTPGIALLRQCQFVIALLSDQSLSSQILAEHLHNARALSTNTSNSLQIIPIRIQCRSYFPYHLEFLNHLHWIIWDSEDDTPKLLAQLDNALRGITWGIDELREKVAILNQTNAKIETFSKPHPYADPGASMQFLEMPTGAVSPDSRFYVERRADAILKNQLRAPFMTVVIRAPRQMGKSSLLKRGKRIAEAANRQVGVIDFQGSLSRQALQDDTLFFQLFCKLIVRAFKLRQWMPAPEDVWEPLLANMVCCTDYVEQYVLQSLQPQSAMLAIDEVDLVLQSEFRSEFFAMLRSWHNKRADSALWRGLSMALVISTEPSMLIDDLNQSPFNVATPITLDDFNYEQVDILNQRHGEPYDSIQLEQLYGWIAGHPYLTRQAMYLAASHQMTSHELLRDIAAPQGPFADHLGYYLNILYERPVLASGMIDLAINGVSPSRDTVFRLQSAGLVRQADGGIVPRCRLYAEFYARNLNLKK